SASGEEASTTWIRRSASTTSSSVDRNDSTSWWGSLRTKPTVSDTSTVSPPVDLQLRLAGPPGADPGALLAHLHAPAPQPGQPVAELGQLDLLHAGLAVGVLGEDVEDQRHPVDDVDLEQLLQVALLRRRQLLVEDHDVDVEHLDQLPQLLGLALADERGRVGRLPPLERQLDRVGAGGVGQQRQLRQRRLGLVEADVAAADQQGPLADDAEVDLGRREAPPLPPAVSVVAHSTPPASGTVSASRSSSTSTSNTKATGPPRRTLRLSPRPLGDSATMSSPPGTAT